MYFESLEEQIADAYVAMRDTAPWEGEPTQEELMCAIQMLRPLYQQWVLELEPLNPLWAGDNIYRRFHSPLYRLEYKEGQEHAYFNPLQRLLSATRKADLMKHIEEELGHRPESIIVRPAQDSTWIQDVAALLDRSGAIYFKRNQSGRGNAVFHIERAGQGLRITPPDGDSFEVPDFNDEFFARLINSNKSYLVDAEIPIAFTEEGETWEIRFVPPYANCDYAKVGEKGSHINNISRGAVGATSEEVVESVIRAKYPNLSDDEREARADHFLHEAFELSKHVLVLVGEIEAKVASAIVDPELADFMRSMVFEVDITGVWDEAGRLKPIIIEAQAGSGLTGLVQQGWRREPLPADDINTHDPDAIRHRHLFFAFEELPGPSYAREIASACIFVANGALGIVKSGLRAESPI